MARKKVAPYVMGAVACLFLISAVLLYRTQTSPASFSYMRDTRVDSISAEAYWREYIRNNGADAAKAALIREGSVIDLAQAHILAHAFGGALFREKGAGGFSACPSEFIWGCYHQFIGDAISELGGERVEKFGSECGNKPPKDTFSCFHGIGHGLVGYWGYTPAAIEKALGECSILNPARPRDGCADGVFMEYNIREMASLDSDGHFIPRPYSYDSRYAPCDEVEELYRDACVFELPDWWVAALSVSLSNNDRVALAGEFCRSIDIGAASAQTCFEGLGNVIPAIAGLDMEKIKSLCSVAAQLHPDERLACLSSAAHRLKVLNVSEDAVYLCTSLGLSGDSITSCIAHTSRAYTDKVCPECIVGLDARHVFS